MHLVCNLVSILSTRLNLVCNLLHKNSPAFWLNLFYPCLNWSFSKVQKPSPISMVCTSPRHRIQDYLSPTVKAIDKGFLIHPCSNAYNSGLEWCFLKNQKPTMNRIQVNTNPIGLAIEIDNRLAPLKGVLIWSIYFGMLPTQLKLTH